MLLLWNLVLIIKMSTCQDFKTIFKYNLTCIFLSLRAQLKKPLCPRTPCIWTILTLFHKSTIVEEFHCGFHLILICILISLNKTKMMPFLLNLNIDFMKDTIIAISYHQIFANYKFQWCQKVCYIMNPPNNQWIVIYQSAKW